MNRNKRGGYIMILNTLLFIAIMLVIIIGIANSVLSHYSSTRGFAYSKQSYLTAYSAAEEALYRLDNGIDISSPLTISFASSSATITITPVGNGKTINVDSQASGFQRKLRIYTVLGTGISFHYGIQSGRGGFVLQNSSAVIGNVFSDGTVTGSGNYIYGDVVSAEATGLISGIHATGTAYAHTIQNSTIDKDAHYMTISNTGVTGTSYPGSSDLPAAPLPISDAQITEWENDAAAGGTSNLCSSGTYSITSATMSIGPLKIPCNLNIKNSTVTIAGPIWVTGNIDIKGSTIDMDSSLGFQNVAVIADNPANTTGSGIISTDTSTSFYAAGCPAACIAGSFIFMISQNNSSETGGSTNAINLGQSSSGIIAYAAHGQITVGQSVNLKEVTAYKIVLSNTAEVTYDNGLPSTLFEAGPGGGYDLQNWLEI